MAGCRVPPRQPGKGSAFVRTKLKNAQTGSVVERTFRAGETVPQANLEKNTMQYTYKDADQLVFMDMATYEESRLNAEQIGDRVKYLKEGMEVNVVTWGDQVLEVELPNSVVLEVTKPIRASKAIRLRAGRNLLRWKRVLS